MSVTLFEAAKLNRLDPVSAAAQLEVARSSMVFRFLPFFERSDFQFDETYDTEEAESSYRAINEELSEGDEDVQTLQFCTGIFGDKVQIDRKLIQMKGIQLFDKKMAQKSFGVGVTYNQSFIKGDKLTDPRQFNGLQSICSKQLPASQTVNAGGAASPLSLSILDAAIMEVRGANIIFCSRSLYLKFTKAARNQAITGNINFVPNDNNRFGAGMGANVAFYNGLPIVPVMGPFNKDNVLPYTELDPDGNAFDSTSLYIANIGENGLYGAQNGPVMANDYGNVQGSVFFKGDVEWSAGVGLAHPLAVCRYNGISNADIVA